MVIPQPQQREATDRPLLPAEHDALEQLVTKLAAATGEPSNRSGNRCSNFPGERWRVNSERKFNHLVTWLQARRR